MGYDQNRAMLESSIARAHRAVVQAKTAAGLLEDDALWLDFQQMEVQLTRLGEASLRGKRRKQIPGQIRMENRDNVPF